MRKLKNSELNRVDVEAFKKLKKIPVVVVLDNIRSLNNVGSFFRTSDAFTVEKIVLCGITAQPPHAEIHKTALGAEDAVEWSHSQEILPILSAYKNEGYQICSIEQAEDATMLDAFEPKKDQKYVLVFGNEVKGVQQEVVNFSDYCIEIPQFGTKHSLNVSVSAGVVLWHFFEKIK